MVETESQWDARLKQEKEKRQSELVQAIKQTGWRFSTVTLNIRQVNRKWYAWANDNRTFCHAHLK